MGEWGSEFFSRYFQIIITLFSEVVGKGKRVKLFVTLLSLICLQTGLMKKIAVK